MAIFTLKSLAVGHLSLRKGSIGSRGETIITQKENKGEYHGINCGNDAMCGGELVNNGSTWYWQESDSQDIYAHVFDQNGLRNSDGTPYQYSTHISDWANNTYWFYPDKIPHCTTTTATGETLYSGTHIPPTNKACLAHTHNAGNFYNYPAATAGSDNHATHVNVENLNSICPKGWRLPSKSLNEKSYNNLILAYGITATDSDSEVLASPISFIRSGYYGYSYGGLNNRGLYGAYWQSTTYNDTFSYHLYFGSKFLDTQSDNNRAYGWSIRCVSR